jgi:hypothetical protein
MNQYEVSILETGETILCSPGQSILDGIPESVTSNAATGQCKFNRCSIR